MVEEGLVPSPKEEQKREIVIKKLNDVSLVLAFLFALFSYLS